MTEAVSIWELAEAGQGVGDSFGEKGGGVNGDDSTTVLVVGDAGVGKSSMIQSFLKPNSTKQPKPTFALEYSFARRKNAGDKGGKSLAHIWELGGDIYEPKLLEIALTTENLSNASIIICLDLSKPQDCFASMKQWVSLLRSHISLKFSSLKSGNSARQAQANTMKENTLGAYGTMENPHVDAGKTRPCEVPVCIMACKYDIFRSKYSSSDRRALMQVLRFAAHYHGASVVVTSSNDSSGKDAFRAYMNKACFGVSMKPICEVTADRPCVVTVGADSYTSILIGKGTGKGSDEDGKSSLASTDSDVSSYVSSSGVQKDVWSRFEGLLAKTFGEADPRAGKGKVISQKRDENSDESNPAIEYPEADVDDARASRDLALEQYVIDAARREKMSARGSLPEETRDAPVQYADTEVDERRRSRK
eukprot:GSChrysophyteH1.ASY1.ANO1.2609.1 assembled CDS